MKLLNHFNKHRVLLTFLPIFHKGKLSLMSKIDKMIENCEHYLAEDIQHTILEIIVGEYQFNNQLLAILMEILLKIIYLWIHFIKRKPTSIFHKNKLFLFLFFETTMGKVMKTSDEIESKKKKLNLYKSWMRSHARQNKREVSQSLFFYQQNILHAGK